MECKYYTQTELKQKRSCISMLPSTCQYLSINYPLYVITEQFSLPGQYLSPKHKQISLPQRNKSMILTADCTPSLLRI